MKKTAKPGAKTGTKRSSAGALQHKGPARGAPAEPREAPMALATGVELSAPRPAPRPATKKPPKRPTNLTLDPDALAQAERFGREHGASVSQLVNRYLHSLPTRELADRPADLSPTVRRLYGVASGGGAAPADRSSDRGADRDDYRAYLEQKYGKRA